MFQFLRAVGKHLPILNQTTQTFESWILTKATAEAKKDLLVLVFNFF